MFVDAFFGFEDGGVLYDGVDFLADDLFDFEGEQAVVQEQDVASFDVFRQFAVVQADAQVFAFAFVGGVEDEFVAAGEFHFAAFDDADADFRALQVGNDGDFTADAAGGFAYFAGVFAVEGGVAVAEVEAHDVQADADHVFEGFFVAAGRADGGDDFGVVADAREVAVFFAHGCSCG